MKTILEQLTAKSSDIRKERAIRVVTTLEMAQRALTDKLKLDIMQLESQIENHTDFGRTSTTSLVVKLEEGTNSNDWVQTYQTLKLKLALKKEELSIAKESYKELFGKINKVVCDINSTDFDKVNTAVASTEETE